MGQQLAPTITINQTAFVPPTSFDYVEVKVSTSAPTPAPGDSGDSGLPTIVVVVIAAVVTIIVGLGAFFYWRSKQTLAKDLPSAEVAGAVDGTDVEAVKVTGSEVEMGIKANVAKKKQQEGNRI